MSLYVTNLPLICHIPPNRCPLVLTHNLDNLLGTTIGSLCGRDMPPLIQHSILCAQAPNYSCPHLALTCPPHFTTCCNLFLNCPRLTTIRLKPPWFTLAVPPSVDQATLSSLTVDVLFFPLLIGHLHDHPLHPNFPQMPFLSSSCPASPTDCCTFLPSSHVDHCVHSHAMAFPLNIEEELKEEREAWKKKKREKRKKRKMGEGGMDKESMEEEGKGGSRSFEINKHL